MGKKAKDKGAKRDKINRARIRKRQYYLVALFSVLGVIIIAITLSQVNSADLGTPVTQSLYNRMYYVSNNYFGQVNYNYLNSYYIYNKSPTYLNGKLLVVYIGYEWCPYCASERWALILALMRFGNFSNLEYMQSTPNDVFPNTPTFTFAKSNYISNYIVFQAYEVQDRNGNPLMPLPANYSSLWRSSIWSKNSGSVPFIDIGNVYIQFGSTVDNQPLIGNSWDSIVNGLLNNSTQFNSIINSANSLTAAICSLLANNSPNICKNNVISKEVNYLKTHYSLSFSIGKPINNATEWASVQYKQIDPIKNTSVNTKYPTNIIPKTQRGSKTNLSLFENQIIIINENQATAKTESGIPRILE
jgi:hypothetical protein